jgi:hypothetical protein
MTWQRVRIPIPKGIGPDDRQEIGEEIVARIVERAKSRKGVEALGDGVFKSKTFPKYSKKYAEWKGVGRESVDLTLSGDMLDALDVISHTSGSILIGMPKDDRELNGKAEGNRTGSYGGAPNPSKARDFMGLPKAELADILRSAVQDDDKLRAKAREFVKSLSVAQKRGFRG